jgi:saccharopine dehydrogenase-like NADP-dependent oxidoreductase
MKNVLILGANGQVARLAIDRFLRDTDAKLTLFLRNPRRSGRVDPARGGNAVRG